MLTPSAIWTDWKKSLKLSDLRVGQGLRLPDLGGSWALTQSLLAPQLTMGRLGQVVEDKKSIQLKDLTSVSHGLAGPGFVGQGSLEMWETRSRDYLSTHPHVIALPTLHGSLRTSHCIVW